MKAKRHATIIRLIKSARVGSQEQLRDLLDKEGTAVTQATLSRDLRELRLSKVADPSGGSFYAVPSDREIPHPSLSQLLPALLLSTEGVGPLLVVKTPQGSAEALGGALDGAELTDYVIGCIAGDDTLLIITRSEQARAELNEKLNSLARS
jgi:transcriptional regulator of arginine metabolism